LSRNLPNPAAVSAAKEVEKAVNNTNKGWEQAEARHRIGRQQVGS